MKLEVLPLDQKTFSAYGDVIETHVMIHQRYDKNRERTEENGI